MIVDLTVQNRSFAAAYKQIEAEALIDTLKCRWSTNGALPRCSLKDEDEIFIPSEHKYCCISNPSCALPKRIGWGDLGNTVERLEERLSSPKKVCHVVRY